jgi:hypothetical protein
VAQVWVPWSQLGSPVCHLAALRGGVRDPLTARRTAVALLTASLPATLSTRTLPVRARRVSGVEDAPLSLFLYSPPRVSEIDINTRCRCRGSSKDSCR